MKELWVIAKNFRVMCRCSGKCTLVEGLGKKRISWDKVAHGVLWRNKGIVEEEILGIKYIL